MAKFRKKPVVIDAVQWTGDNYQEISNFAWPDCGLCGHIPVINTLEGMMQVSDGDWIIRGVNGEFYPCKPDIFEKTYELVEEVE